MKKIFWFLIVLSYINCNSQNFSRISPYYENVLPLKTTCSFRDSLMLVLHYDSSYQYPDSIINFSAVGYRDVLSVYNAQGDRIKRVPVHYRIGDTFLYYTYYWQVKNQLIGRAIQSVKSKDGYYKFWIRFSEINPMTLLPTTRYTTDFLGYSRFETWHPTSDAMPLYTVRYGLVDDTRIYSSFFYKKYDSSNNFINWVYITQLFNMSDFSMTKSIAYDKDPNVLKSYLPLYQTYFYRDTIKSFSLITYDTLGISSNPNTLYNTVFLKNLSFIDTFILKLDVPKYTFSPLSPFASGIVSNEGVFHNFNYGYCYKRVNGKMTRFGGVFHYQIKADSLLFVKFLDTQINSFGIAAEKVISSSSNNYHLLVFRPKVSDSIIRVFKLDSSLQVIWRKDYLNPQRILFNEDDHFIAFKNELGGINLVFQASNWIEGFAIYMLKIDSNGNAIKLSGKDLTKSDIHLAASSNTIHIYPNPSSDKIYIHHVGEQARIYEYQLYNLLGQIQLVSFEYNSEQAVADVKSIPSGIYILEIRDKKSGNILQNSRVQITH